MPPLISESAQNLVPIIPHNSPKFPMTSPQSILVSNKENEVDDKDFVLDLGIKIIIDEGL